MAAHWDTQLVVMMASMKAVDSVAQSADMLAVLTVDQKADEMVVRWDAQLVVDWVFRKAGLWVVHLASQWVGKTVKWKALHLDNLKAVQWAAVTDNLMVALMAVWTAWSWVQQWVEQLATRTVACWAETTEAQRANLLENAMAAKTVLKLV